MNQKNKHLFSNVGILALSNFSTKLLSLFLVPLYTGILTTEEYGIFDLVMVTVELLVPIITLNISDALMRFLLDPQRNKTNITEVGLKYITISLLVASLIILVCSQLPIFEIYSELFALIWLYFLTHLIHQFLIQYAKGMDAVRDIGIVSVLSAIISLSLNIILLVVFGMGIKGFFVSTIIATSFSALYLFVRLKLWHRIRLHKVDRQLEKEMLSYSIPLIFTAVSWWANSSLDKYVITFFCGVAANGLISVAYKIPSIMNTIQSIFIQAWQISAIKEYEEGKELKFYENTFWGFNMFLCGAGFGLILLSKFIAGLMFSNDFYQAWIYVPFLIIASIINSASGFLGPMLSAEKKTKVFAVAAIVGLVTNFVLNVVLVYVFGIQGATIATVISSFSMYAVRKRSVFKFISPLKHMAIIFQWILLCAQAVIKIFELSVWFELLIGFILIMLNIGFIKNVIQAIIKKRHADKI